MTSSLSAKAKRPTRTRPRGSGIDECGGGAFARWCRVTTVRPRAPLLALQALRTDARLGFLFAPELSVYETGADDPFVELDVWAIVEGRVCVGEAKTVDRLAGRGERETIDRLVRVADAVTADELVIATTEPALRPATRELLEKALSGRRSRLRVLERAALDEAAGKVGGYGVAVT